MKYKIFRLPAFRLLPVLLIITCAPRFTIRTWPIRFTEKRVQMTRDYIGRHYHIRTDDIRIQPRIIVLHWTGLPSAENSFQVFDRETYNKGRQLNVSAHYLITRDGNIIRLMPDTWMANHTFGLNYVAIGIENVGGANGYDDLTIEQIEANAAMVRYLVDKYPGIHYLIGHHEYQCFIGHPLYLERTFQKPPTRIDPGDHFMRAVRMRVADLNLKGPEAIVSEAKSAIQQHKKIVRFNRR